MKRIEAMCVQTLGDEFVTGFCCGRCRQQIFREPRFRRSHWHGNEGKTEVECNPFVMEAKEGKVTICHACFGRMPQCTQNGMERLSHVSNEEFRGKLLGKAQHLYGFSLAYCAVVLRKRLVVA